MEKKEKYFFERRGRRFPWWDTHALLMDARRVYIVTSTPNLFCNRLMLDSISPPPPTVSPFIIVLDDHGKEYRGREVSVVTRRHHGQSALQYPRQVWTNTSTAMCGLNLWLLMSWIYGIIYVSVIMLCYNTYIRKVNIPLIIFLNTVWLTRAIGVFILVDAFQSMQLFLKHGV
jgi:hypothetical protein